ncbi:unnamed protein product [Closterium sp. NIES-53]
MRRPCSPARRPCSQRAAHAAPCAAPEPRAPPLQPRAPPLQPRAPPLQPRVLPMQPCAPPLQPSAPPLLPQQPCAPPLPHLRPARRPYSSRPARCPYSPRAARLRPVCRPCSPHAACLWPTRHSCNPLAACVRRDRLPCSSLAAHPAAHLSPLAACEPPLAARSPPLCSACVLYAVRRAPLYSACWLTRDAAAHLAIRSHLPLAECAHFGQHKTAKALYDALVARYSSPATAALGHLILPYLFPELFAFATAEDLLSHLRTSDARYRAALPAEFLDRNPPPMYITLYFILTRLPDSLRAVRDHFLALDPTDLTADLLEQHLLAAETSVVAVGAAPCTPFFEGCSPSPLAPSYASAAAVGVFGAEDVGAASASGKRCSSKGKGGRSGGGGSGGGSGGGTGGGGGSGGGGSGGSGGGSGVFGGDGGGDGGGIGGSGSSGSGGCGGSWGGAVQGGDAILAAMYALSVSAEGDSYLCVLLDPRIEAAALGARESALPGTARAEALHTFTLDSRAFCCLHLPSFSTNLVSTAALQDAMVPTTTPGDQRASICTCTWTGRHLATFTRGPGSSLYTLATKPPQVSASTKVSVSLPPLPPLPAPPCLPCVEGQQRAAPHSSSFPPTTAPLQTLHMDVWGPARISGQGRGRYFLLVVEDYMRYTTVFPLRRKGEVPDVLIPWICAVRLQLRERFHADLPVLRLHSDRRGDFSSDLLREFCHGEGILQSFTLLASLQTNWIAECRIGLVMEVTCTSMIHVAPPHILWPFAVQYAAHQLNLWPRVSLPETSPTLRWTGKVGDASVFWVWGSRAFDRDSSADKLSACAIPSVFLGFPPDAPGWQFYHPTSCRVYPFQDVTFDESVPFYHLFPYRSAPPPPRPLFLAPDPLFGTVPVEVAVDSGAARGAASGVAASGGAELMGAENAGVEPGGAEPEGVEPGGARFESVERGGAESEGAESWDSAAGDTRAGGVGATRLGGAGVTAGAGGTGGAAAAGSGGARTRGTGAAGAGSVGGAAAGEARAGDPAELGGAGARGAGALGTVAGGARVGGAEAGDTGVVSAGAGGPGAGGARAGGAGSVDPGARGAEAGGAVSNGAGVRSTVQPQPYFVPLLQQVLGLPSSTRLTPPLLCPTPDLSQPLLQPASPQPSPSPYTGQTGGLKEHHEPVSRPASPVHAVCTGHRVPRSSPPRVPGTHAMALRPSSVPLRVPLPPPPASWFPAVPDPESDLACAASPTVSRLLATVVTDPSFDSTTASTLVAELVDFAAAYRLDYATALVAESGSTSPRSIEGECDFGTDVLEDRQDDFECLAAAVPCFASMLLAPEGDPDAPDIPIPRSYREAITGVKV